MSDEPRRCSFCNKSRDQVATLIAGPHVHICDEGIALCQEILFDAEDGALAVSYRPGIQVGASEADLLSMLGEPKARRPVGPPCGPDGCDPNAPPGSGERLFYTRGVDVEVAVVVDAGRVKSVGARLLQAGAA